MRVAERQGLVNLIPVAASVAALREIPGAFELRNDGSSRSLGDPDLRGHLREAHHRVVADDLEHVRVVRDEAETVVTVTGS